MTSFQDFHHRPASSNRGVQLSIGAIILALLAGLGVYAYSNMPVQPHSAVWDKNLPSP